MVKKEIKKEAKPKVKKEVHSNSIDVPSDVKVTIDKTTLSLESKGIIQVLPYNQVYVLIEHKDNKLIITARKTPKRFLSVANTTLKIIKNALLGFTKEFVYKLSVIYSHFPITVKIEGDKILIMNFLGEKKPRKTEIMPGVKVVVAGKDITVSGHNLHNVSLTAGNIERTSKVVGHDYRIFDDGCYITERHI
ncbi:MAG: 50S ribosomal protein L6 [archaeon]